MSGGLPYLSFDSGETFRRSVIGGREGLCQVVCHRLKHELAVLAHHVAIYEAKGIPITPAIVHQTDRRIPIARVLDEAVALALEFPRSGMMIGLRSSDAEST